MRYHRLTLAERYQIRALLDTKTSRRVIARVLKVSPSTIKRELERCAGQYCPKKANAAAKNNRKGVGPKKKIIGKIKTQVDRMLAIQWSPMQIRQRLKKMGMSLSHETIYQYVYRQHVEERDRKLYLNLRRQRRWRRSREKLKNQRRCSSRPDRISIGRRPKIVEKRNRAGDFERDLILGKNGRLLTIVDRASKLVKIGKLNRSTAEETHKETLRLLKRLKVHTITNDHGHEFSFHRKTGKQLGARVYFADPHCPWQRGTNENTNGLIRQYFPKGSDFSKVTTRDLKKIENLLNSRPRKILGYRTPSEVHRQLSQGVALST